MILEAFGFYKLDETSKYFFIALSCISYKSINLFNRKNIKVL